MFRDYRAGSESRRDKADFSHTKLPGTKIILKITVLEVKKNAGIPHQPK